MFISSTSGHWAIYFKGLWKVEKKLSSARPVLHDWLNIIDKKNDEPNNRKWMCTLANQSD